MLPSCARTSTAPAHEKNGEQAIGRSRGGLTTKIHALVDALGNPVDVMLTPGQAHDLACAEPLLEEAVPEIVTRERFPDGGESDSTWRTQEARHVGADTIAPGF